MHQRHVGEAGRRLTQERSARDGHHPHEARSVALGEHGRRPAGRVIAGLALPLEQDHRAPAREMVGGRGACYPSTDDDKITVAYRHDTFSFMTARASLSEA